MGQKVSIILVLDPEGRGGLELADALEDRGFEVVLGRCPRRALRMARNSHIGFDQVVFFGGSSAGEPSWLDAMWDAQPQTRCLVVSPDATEPAGDGFRYRAAVGESLDDPEVVRSISEAFGRGTPGRSGATQELVALSAPPSISKRGASVPFELWESR